MKTAVLQRRTQCVHGLAYGNSTGGGGMYPMVKAFLGLLPSRQEGVEFTTALRPNVIFPSGLCYWQPGSSAFEEIYGIDIVEIDDRAVLSVEMPYRNTRYGWQPNQRG